MTVWEAITVDDLYPYLVAAQIAALRTAALSTSNPNQGDPFNAVMPSQAARVRGAIASGKSNVLASTPASVPPSARWVLCYLVLEVLQARLPGLTFSKSQLESIRDAKKWLDDVAADKIQVEYPTLPEEDFTFGTSTNTSLINPRSVVTPEKLTGL